MKISFTQIFRFLFVLGVPFLSLTLSQNSQSPSLTSERLAEIEATGSETLRESARHGPNFTCSFKPSSEFSTRPSFEKDSLPVGLPRFLGWSRYEQAVLEEFEFITTSAPFNGREPSYFDPGYVRQRLDAATVLIINYTEEGRIQGSGVLIDKSCRLVATADHVMEDEITCAVFRSLTNTQGKRWEVDDYINSQSDLRQKNLATTGRVVAHAPGKDLSILQLDSVPENMEEISLASKAPDAGEHIYFMGCPAKRQPFVFGVGEMLSETSLSIDDESENTEEAKAIEFYGESFPGKSGCPMVNSDIQLIGIVSRGLHFYQEQKAYGIHFTELSSLWRSISEKQTLVISNDTKSELNFELWNPVKEEWSEWNLSPNHCRTFWARDYGDKYRIRFDNDMTNSTSYTTYPLDTRTCIFGMGNNALPRYNNESGDYQNPMKYRFAVRGDSLDLFQLDN